MRIVATLIFGTKVINFVMFDQVKTVSSSEFISWYNVFLENGESLTLAKSVIAAS